LAGALGGVILTGLFALFTSRLNNSAERQKPLAEQSQRRWELEREENKLAYSEWAMIAMESRDKLQVADFQH
jgi:hypothetical protein